MTNKLKELPQMCELERLEYLLGVKFSRWDKLKCKLLCKWWIYKYRSSHIKGKVLRESFLER